MENKTNEQWFFIATNDTWQYEIVSLTYKFQCDIHYVNVWDFHSMKFYTQEHKKKKEFALRLSL